MNDRAANRFFLIIRINEFIWFAEDKLLPCGRAGSFGADIVCVCVGSSGGNDDQQGWKCCPYNH